MKLYALTSPGLEKTATQEISELINTTPKVLQHAVEFEATTAEEIATIIYHSQSIKRLLLSFGCYNDPSQCQPEADWELFFNNGTTFKIDVEHVKDQEQRTIIQKELATKIAEQLKQHSLPSNIDLKNPTLTLFVYYNQQQYLIGLDLFGRELNNRFYRVFPHSGSFKGDLAYHIIRLSQFQKDEKLLIGFVKDGTLAIEAALFATNKPVQEDNLPAIPFFGNISAKTTEQPAHITAFDPSMQNFTAARKNAKLANLSKDITITKRELDELDTHFDNESFDLVIFHITQKDETKINEIYYQTKYILKPGGRLAIITRPSWELSISNAFTLLKKESIPRGEGSSVLWLLQKK